MKQVSDETQTPGDRRHETPMARRIPSCGLTETYVATEIGRDSDAYPISRIRFAAHGDD